MVVVKRLPFFDWYYYFIKFDFAGNTGTLAISITCMPILAHAYTFTKMDLCIVPLRWGTFPFHKDEMNGLF